MSVSFDLNSVNFKTVDGATLVSTTGSGDMTINFTNVANQTSPTNYMMLISVFMNTSPSVIGLITVGVISNAIAYASYVGTQTGW